MQSSRVIRIIDATVDAAIAGEPWRLKVASSTTLSKQAADSFDAIAEEAGAQTVYIALQNVGASDCMSSSTTVTIRSRYSSTVGVDLD